MTFLVISGSPKNDGLCHSVVDEVIRGASDGGAEVKTLKVNSLERCRMCGDGWGSCRASHKCDFGDDGFNDAQQTLKDADIFCFITPVYWEEMSEGLKCFFDKLRRCEFRQNGVLSGKQVLLVASPGGTGNGVLPCLEQMNRFCKHTGAIVFDYIGINRWNNDYKKVAAYEAARAMATGRKAGETI